MDYKCIGCGANLQTEDENKVGYIKKEVLEKKEIEDLYCMRCFKLKHYNIKSPINNPMIKKSFDEIRKDNNGIIGLMVDVFLLDSSFYQDLYEKVGRKKIVLIVSKFDCFKDIINKRKIIDYLKMKASKNKYYILDIIFADEIDKMLDIIENNLSNFYFMGYTNSGKSTFLNKIIKRIYDFNKDVILTSKNVGTTIDLIKIPIDEKYFLIDTPGLNMREDFSKYVITKKVKPRIYQVRENQSYIIDDFISINIYDEANIVFYINNEIEIHRTKNINKKDFLIFKKNIKLVENIFYDIEIGGIGFFRIKGLLSFDLTMQEEMDIYVRKSII